MTDAEDAHNAVLNELIRACPHEHIQKVDGEIRCGRCPARFAVVMFARRRPAFTLDLDEFGEDHGR
jgi:hypothetical protein